MNTPSDTYEFEAIGTHWWLERLDGGKFSESIREALATYTAEFDRRYSRFREDAVVIQLARDGIVKDPPSEMIAMLNYAKELYEASEGTFSLLVGNALQSLGYGKSFLRNNYGSSIHLLGNGRVSQIKQRSASKNVRSDLTRFGRKDILWSKQEVRVTKGIVLDFGGLGKGWLIDEYVKILREHNVKTFIVNGGGDLYVQSDTSISFALEHPYNPALKIGDIELKQGALAASSTVKRAWKDSEKAYHHIINPMTGKPSETDVVATFVRADSALVADSLATILIIRPDLKDSLEKRYGATALLVNQSNMILS